MHMYSEADVDTSVLGNKQVTILGYGSQGRAHALNLKDSGMNVVVGLRPEGASWAKAEADGLTVMPPAEAVAGAAHERAVVSVARIVPGGGPTAFIEIPGAAQAVAARIGAPMFW